MQPVPHLQNAIVPPRKLTHYLLAPTHEEGAGKARFFHSFGFEPIHWPELAAALLNHVAEHGIVGEEATPFGTRYIVEGPLSARDGRAPNLRSIWFLDPGSETPRFITAYPLEETSDD